MSRKSGQTRHWQVQEAKQRLSEVLEQAKSRGPQVVTKHGREVAVVLSIDDYRRLQQQQPDFRTFLLSMPSLEGVDLERDKTLPRDVEL